jgi:hypothetical protein
MRLKERKSTQERFLDISLYYTFSTIAQSLAGAVALIAAFLLYRLQSMNAAMEACANKVIPYYSRPETRVHLDDLHVRADYDAIGEVFGTLLPADLEQGEVGFARRRLIVLVASRRALSRIFVVSLILTVGLIAASVLVLAITPTICRDQRAVRVVLTVGVSWLIVCLTSFAILVRKALS